MDSKRITIHIADDHQILIDGIMAVLKSDPAFDVVGYSLDGAQTIDWFKSDKSDVLILDVGMPNVDGIGVLEYFQNEDDIPLIIMLTSYNDVKLIKEVLKMGAKGFLTKENAGESIIEAIKVVVNGDLYFSKDIRNKIVNSFTGVKVAKTEKTNQTIQSLSNREIEVLKLLTQEYSNKDIAESLSISVTTVETHKRNIMNKLGVKNTMGLAIYVVKNQLFDF